MDKILFPKVCLADIPFEITGKIEQVNWADFETAYGNAEKTIPLYLKNLFCSDTEIAMDATHQLWCSLCHQHAFISSASLPAYNILKIGLLQLNDDLKIELLDIFQGFAYCSSPTFNNFERADWEMQLRERLFADITLFEELASHTNEDISGFADNILGSLSTDKNQAAHLI